MHLTKSLKKLFVFLRFFALFIVTTEGEGAFGWKLIPLFERGAFPFSFSGGSKCTYQKILKDL